MNKIEAQNDGITDNIKEEQGSSPREIDEEPGVMPSSLMGESEKSAAAAALVIAMLSGSFAASAEAPKRAIVIEGEMPSQKKGFGGEMAGGGGDPIQYITLEPGSKGQKVKDLKQRMFDLGYFKNESSVNEIFTDKTAEYVKKFEEINGLPVDGIADPEMQALFFSDSAKRVDRTQVVATEVTPKSEEIQVEPEVDNTQVTPNETTSNVEMTEKSPEEEKEVNQRFSDFLNGVGDFEENKIKGKTIIENGFFTDLGFYHVKGEFPDFHVQSIMLHHIGGETAEYLALGIKNKEGERKIVAVEWPTKLTMEAAGYIVIGTSVGGSCLTDQRFETKDDTVNFLNENNWTGKMIVGTFTYDDYNENYSDENIIKYFEYVETRISISLDFVAGLLLPEKVKLNSADKDFLKKIKNQKTTLKGITSLSEMKEIIRDSEKCPIMTYLKLDLTQK